MAFIAPLLGLTGLGAALFEVGAAVGLGFLAKSLAPKPSDTSLRGRSISLRRDANAPRQIILGEFGTAGSLADWYCYGDNNEHLVMVIALADHVCHSITEVRVNDTVVTWNSSTGAVSEYPDVMSIKFYDGTQTTAPSLLVSTSGGRWSSTDAGANVAYVVIDLVYNETLFPSGIPRFKFAVQGALLYDMRLDSTAGGSGSQRWADPTTWAWSDNPAVMIANVIRGVYCGSELLSGLEATAEAVRYDDFAAAANACDESVSLKAGGTEKRYTGAGVWDAGDPRSILEDLIAAMAGEVIEAGGIYRIIAGVAQGSVASLTDDDLIVGEAFTTSPKRSRSELINAVFASFRDPAQAYAAVPLPPRTSSTDEALDGGNRYSQKIDLSAVRSRGQGQRVAEITRRRGRRQITATATFRARWFCLEVGDWITFTSTRRGYDTRTFEVLTTRGRDDLTTEITLREVDDAIDDWTASVDELDDNTSTNLPSAGPTLSAVAGFAIENITVEVPETGAQRPGLRATWTAIDDQTVRSLRIEYRRQGDTTALEVTALEPSAGQYSWVNGVQGGCIYEARALPATQPERAVDWTSWANTGSDAPVHKVEVSLSAEGVEPGVIGETELDAQTRFELGLVTAVDTALGSVAQSTLAERTKAEMAAEAAIAGLLETHTNRTLIKTEQIERVADGEALASLITTVSTSVDGNTADISTLQTSVNGIYAEWGVVIDVNGYVVGAVRLDGGASQSTFTATVNEFKIAAPGVSGGSPVPVFAVQTVNGAAKVALRGDMIVDGSIVARHLSVSTLSAIAADVGTVTAGVLRSSDSKFVIDLTNKTITITT